MMICLTKYIEVMEKRRLFIQCVIVLICLFGVIPYSHAQSLISYDDMQADITWENIGKTPMKGVTNDGLFQFIAEKGPSASTFPTVNSKGNDVRIYANSTLGLKNVNSDHMTTVVFTVSKQGKERLSTMTVDNGTLQYEGSDKVIWTGRNSSFVITVPGISDLGTESGKAAQFCFDAVSVTYETSGSSLLDPECTFTEASVTGNIGQDFIAPEFKTVSDGAVTYTSSNADVAAVDPSTGVVTLLSEGTTTIKATVAATETYAAGFAFYELTVINPYTSQIFFEDFANGLGQFTNENENGLWETGTYKGQIYAVANAYRKGAVEEKLISSVIDLTNVDQAVLTFEHAIGYIDSNDPKTDFTLWIKVEGTSEWVQLTIPSYPKTSAGWSSFVSSGDIDLQTYCGKRVQIAFQYKSTEEKQSGWEVSKVLVEGIISSVQISVSAAGYATYFNNKAWVVPENMEAGIVTGVNDHILGVDWIYVTGKVVPANTAVLIKAPEQEYTCSLSSDKVAVPTGNLLKGTLENAMTEGENCVFYKLAYDQQGENLGFYWGAENGAAFMNQAYKAYLALPQAQASEINGFLIDTDGGTTGVTDIQAKNIKVDVYTLGGVLIRQQVEAVHALDGLQKGIYIVNGKKIIK